MTILRWLGSLLILLTGLALLFIAHQRPEFAIWYAAHVFPIFPHTIGRFFGLFPFSVFEILLISMVVGLAAGILFAIVNLFSRSGRSRLVAQAKVVPLRLFYLLSMVLLIFVLTAGVNYSRESYADHVGITVQPSSADELIRLYLILVERAELLADQIETDADGHFTLQKEGLYDYARQSMYNLNSVYGGLGTSFPRAKAPVLSRTILSHSNISGFFSPWTMEAHYNGDMPSTSIPFVINHELAHVAGQMREDEANFVAYLASRNATRVDFQYSAVYVALSYTLNALHRAVGRERYVELYDMLPEQMRRDFAYARAYWRNFEGQAADLATRANDTYLRLNRQEDGVQSYGRMVDLLLAYYRE
ncbi:MAG: DUF3810 domain-containing protein [Defluviitaleaceae bacterium]|nr:DUF3810 domain-containing protein [Defluviitaleaceae bacterium]